MKEYEKQYYFMMRSVGDERVPSLSPDRNTSERKYDIRQFSLGEPPFIFVNGALDYNKKRGVPSLKKIPDVLFDGLDLLIPSTMREALLELNISGLYMYPSVYIHDDGKWYENYWYMSFVEGFDCWSRLRSDYDKDGEAINLGGFELHQIYHYAFNDDLLNSIPESQRLLFKMGGSLDPFIVCHESILNIFKSGNGNGIKFVQIGDY